MMMMIALPQTLTPYKTKLWRLKEWKMKTREGKLKEWTQKINEWTMMSHLLSKKDITNGILLP